MTSHDIFIGSVPYFYSYFFIFSFFGGLMRTFPNFPTIRQTVVCIIHLHLWLRLLLRLLPVLVTIIYFTFKLLGGARPLLSFAALIIRVKRPFPHFNGPGNLDSCEGHNVRTAAKTPCQKKKKKMDTPFFLKVLF